MSTDAFESWREFLFRRPHPLEGYFGTAEATVEAAGPCLT